MKIYRIFLLGLLTVSWIFLSGLKVTVDNDMLAQENQKKTVELESSDTEHKRKLSETKRLKANPQKTKPATIKASDAVVAEENPTKNDELEKPLDLSVPFKDSENADLKNEQKPAEQSRVTNLFAPETKKKPRPLELNGDFLMSPEPEAEKLKSVDGAGIVIKLKP